MATVLQEKLAEEIVKNKSLPRYKRKNKGEMLASVGYSKSVAKAKPQEIIDQPGVQEEVKKYLSETGLTKELITSALVYDIENKPKRREKELRLGAEILGITEHERNGGNKTLIINITGETANRYGILPTPKEDETS